MKEKTRRWDIQDSLQNIDQVVDYLNASIELNDKDFLPTVIADAVIALARIAHADPYAEPETPADPYAKERKWLGKLCTFWDDDVSVWKVGTLVDIQPEAEDGKKFTYRPADSTEYFYFTQRFKYCRPVAADDELIYKGE